MNTEFKGTPGPWEFVPAAPDDLDGNHNGRDMGGFRSAKGWVCFFGDATTYYPTEGQPPDPADARLIAAAPELLEALERLVDSVNPESSGWGEAVNAIAKALGQQE